MQSFHTETTYMSVKGDLFRTSFIPVLFLSKKQPERRGRFCSEMKRIQK